MSLSKELDPRIAKGFGIFAAVIAFLAMFFLFSVLAKLTPLHSDRALLVLYADEMLSGNVGLRGWNLTTVGFYNELPLYLVAVQWLGVSLDVMRLVPAFINAVNVTLLCLLIWRYGTKASIALFIPVLVYLVMPSNGAWIQLLQAMTHQVTTSCILLTLLILPKGLTLEKIDWRSICCFAISMIATWSDLAYVFLFVGPLIAAVWWVHRSGRESLVLSTKTVLLPILIGAVIGHLLVHVMKALEFGSASGVAAFKFESAGRLAPKLGTEMRDWSAFFGDSFWGHEVNLYSISLVFLTVGLIWWLISAWRSLIEADSVIDVLAVTMFVFAVAFTVCSDRGSTLDNARFLLPAYFAAVFLITRYWQDHLSNRWYQGLAASLVVASIIVSLPFYSQNRLLLAGDVYGSRLKAPMEFLAGLNLRSGFADFWAGHLLRTASANKLELAPVRVGPKGDLIPMYWGSDIEWIRGAKGKFAVFCGEFFGEYDNGPQSRNAFVRSAIETWGEPDRIEEVEGLVFLIWNTDKELDPEKLNPIFRVDELRK